MNDHLRSGKSSSSTDNVDMNVDVDAAKVIEVVKDVGGRSAGYMVVA